MSVIKTAVIFLFLTTLALAQDTTRVYLNPFETKILADILKRHDVLAPPTTATTTKNRYGESSTITELTMNKDTFDAVLAALKEEQNATDRDAMLAAVALYYRFHRAQIDSLRNMKGQSNAK